MKKNEVSRDSKLKIKLRTSEAKRVVAVRELGEARAEAVKFERMWKATVGELKWRKKERDEARREFCEVESVGHHPPEVCAAERGWKGLYDEEATSESPH